MNKILLVNGIKEGVSTEFTQLDYELYYIIKYNYFMKY